MTWEQNRAEKTREKYNRTLCLQMAVAKGSADFVYIFVAMSVSVHCTFRCHLQKSSSMNVQVRFAACRKSSSHRDEEDMLQVNRTSGS